MGKLYNIVTGVGHFVGGVLTALAACLLNPALAAVMFACFIIYELDEDWHIKDKAYRDIKVYAVGLFGAVAALLGVRAWLGL